MTSSKSAPDRDRGTFDGERYKYNFRCVCYMNMNPRQVRRYHGCPTLSCILTNRKVDSNVSKSWNLIIPYIGSKAITS